MNFVKTRCLFPARGGDPVDRRFSAGVPVRTYRRVSRRGQAKVVDPAQTGVRLGASAGGDLTLQGDFLNSTF